MKWPELIFTFNYAVCIFFLLVIGACRNESGSDTGPEGDAALREFISHDFLVDRYDSMHWSPLQEKYRKLQPVPVGVVYLHKEGESEEEIRETFRTMKKLGFTANKQVLGRYNYSNEELMLMALEAGLIPWWYGEGGWEEITPELLHRLGIVPNASMEMIRNDPRMIEYQTGVLRNRILRMIEYKEKGYDMRGTSVAFITEIGDKGIDLTPEGEELFGGWLRQKYPNVPAEEISAMVDRRDPRDVFRFKSDMRLEFTREKIEIHRAFDPQAPYRAGGEMSLFLPHAYWGVDLEGVADLMTDAGSFYPSIHLSWHFNNVDHEILIPVYIQASFAADLFKGGWSAAWESTAGPQQFSGRKQGNGFTVDAGVMTQLCYSYMAGGFKGFGFWCWSNSPKGGGPGEYGLVDRYKEVTPRAIKVGKIGQAARAFRDEIWTAHKEPLVGIYYDWENEADWAALSVRGRDHFRQDPVSARVGACRAFVNADIPFEFVTATDLRKGLSGRYRIIFLPQVLDIPEDVVEVLYDYVRQGGRLVMDMPGAYRDVMDLGTPLHEVFGLTITDYQYSGVNRNYFIDGVLLQGFTCDVAVDGADVLAIYDDDQPAVCEHKFGDGQAVLLGFAASRMCFEPGNEEAERLLCRYTLGRHESPYHCAEAIVYRLASPKADHYFFINDEEAKEVLLDTKLYTYEYAHDPLSGDTLAIGDPIALDRHSGRWLRFVK